MHPPLRDLRSTLEGMRVRISVRSYQTRSRALTHCFAVYLSTRGHIPGARCGRLGLGAPETVAAHPILVDVCPLPGYRRVCAFASDTSEESCEAISCRVFVESREYLHWAPETLEPYIICKDELVVGVLSNVAFSFFREFWINLGEVGYKSHNLGYP